MLLKWSNLQIYKTRSRKGKRTGQSTFHCEASRKTHKNMTNSQFGMLMPAGMPEPPKARMSREVKSGRRKVSFSYSLGHGRWAKRCSAPSTSAWNLALMALFTTATKPASQRNGQSELLINWILMFSQPYWVTSGQWNWVISRSFA